MMIYQGIDLNQISPLAVAQTLPSTIFDRSPLDQLIPHHAVDNSHQCCGILEQPRLYSRDGNVSRTTVRLGFYENSF